MIRKTFIHLPGIGEKKEKSIWEHGISDWEHLRPNTREFFGNRRAKVIQKHLDESLRQLDRENLHYFYELLPRSELWRLVPGQVNNIAFLDIETTGLGRPPMDQSTTITVLWRGKLYQEYKKKHKRALLRTVASEAKLLCTYFGEVFDVPFLMAEFGINFNMAHVDLCFWLRRHSYTGGLKNVEQMFERTPSRKSKGIEGLDAIRLWRLHLNGVKGALDTLLTYNAEDTIVLSSLLVEAFNMEAGCPIELFRLITIVPFEEQRSSKAALMFSGIRSQSGS